MFLFTFFSVAAGNFKITFGAAFVTDIIFLLNSSSQLQHFLLFRYVHTEQNAQWLVICRMKPSLGLHHAATTTF